MEAMKWLAKVSATDLDEVSINQVAQRAGLTQSVLNRRAKQNDLTADQTIAIARAYRYDIIRALLELGFVTESDLRQPHVIATLRDATDEQIVAEVARRIREGGSTAYDAPIDLSPVPDLPVVDDTMPDESRFAANTDDLDSEDEQ